MDAVSDTLTLALPFGTVGQRIGVVQNPPSLNFSDMATAAALVPAESGMIWVASGFAGASMPTSSRRKRGAGPVS